jgi:hypothetical protein
MEDSLFEKITQKKNFSEIPREDIEIVFEMFENLKISEFEKIKKTRDVLRKVYSGFSGKKLFNLKERDYKYVLKKHLSTRERFDFYEEVYSRILNNFDKKERINIIDLGAGVNGFSYPFFNQLGYKKINYLGFEAVGQFAKSVENYLLKNKFEGKSFHLSLFSLDEILSEIKKCKGKKVIFLFKVIDAIETIKRGYSFELINLLKKEGFDLMVVSFATESWFKRKKFFVKRNWIINYLDENFQIVDDFETGGERYIVFKI